MLSPDSTTTVSSFDRTRLAVQEFGQGPPLVIGNGIGVSYPGLAHQIEHLSRRFRVVTWDYRGLFGSDPAEWGGLGLAAHARDVLAVMDALEIEQAAFLGWSMGVQVGFELLRIAPRRLVRLAGISGGSGQLFRSAMGIPRGFDRALAQALERTAPLAPRFSKLTQRLVPSVPFYWASRLVRFVGPQTDRAMYDAMARAVAGHDHRVYLTTLAELGRHDASRLLPRLDLPLLFLVGSKDGVTPPHYVEALAAKAPNARVHVVPGASHFVTVEEPAKVNHALEEFFRPWANSS